MGSNRVCDFGLRLARQLVRRLALRLALRSALRFGLRFGVGLFVLVIVASLGVAQEPADAKKMKFAIAIHGGAGSSPDQFNAEANQARRASLEVALTKGVEILKADGSSLDAVEAVIQILEDDPQFNAGKGAVFNAEGSHELDASIMDGNGLKCGAVAGVSHVKNPIKLARLVMTETRHVLLSGPGAETFAQQQGVDWVEPSYFDTKRAKASWERYKERMMKKASSLELPQKREYRGLVSNVPDLPDLPVLTSTDPSFETEWNMGTVGCVALDSSGNLAAGTSTGGMTFKKFGRVGDSPIVGAGTYADNQSCAVSGTGVGEEYIRNAVAFDISAQMKYKGATLQEAIDDNLQNRLKKGDGGLIGVDKDGNIYMGFNTGGMARAAADSAGKFEVIWGNK